MEIQIDSDLWRKIRRLKSERYRGYTIKYETIYESDSRGNRIDRYVRSYIGSVVIDDGNDKLQASLLPKDVIDYKYGIRGCFRKDYGPSVSRLARRVKTYR